MYDKYFYMENLILNATSLIIGINKEYVYINNKI